MNQNTPENAGDGEIQRLLKNELLDRTQLLLKMTSTGGLRLQVPDTNIQIIAGPANWLASQIIDVKFSGLPRFDCETQRGCDDPIGVMDQNEFGDWVRYADVVALGCAQRENESSAGSAQAGVRAEPAEQVQISEPVAWMVPLGDHSYFYATKVDRVDPVPAIPLYATPVAAAPARAGQAQAESVKLDDIEQYRIQMAGISTAALGYWSEGDSIHPDYDTPALRDVAKLYAKYAALYAQVPAAEVANVVFMRKASDFGPWIECEPSHKHAVRFVQSSTADSGNSGALGEGAKA